MKTELSDTEGLRFKVDEKNHNIVELKKTVTIKVCINSPNIYVNITTSYQAQELSEVAVKIGLLEKKVDNASIEVWALCFKVCNCNITLASKLDAHWPNAH